MTSLCCDAPARYGVHEFDGEYFGICSACGENASFEEE